MTPTKHCRECLTDKPREEFYNKSGSRGICKICHGIKTKERHARRIAAGLCRRCDNPLGTLRADVCDEHALIGRESSKARYWVKWYYGVGEDDRASQLAELGHCCEACGRVMTAEESRVDHDHRCCPNKGSCGACIRGLICNGCNAALGLVEDSRATLEALIHYLDRYEAAKP